MAEKQQHVGDAKWRMEIERLHFQREEDVRVIGEVSVLRRHVQHLNKLLRNSRDEQRRVDEENVLLRRQLMWAFECSPSNTSNNAATPLVDHVAGRELDRSQRSGFPYFRSQDTKKYQFVNRSWRSDFPGAGLETQNDLDKNTHSENWATSSNETFKSSTTAFTQVGADPCASFDALVQQREQSRYHNLPFDPLSSHLRRVAWKDLDPSTHAHIDDSRVESSRGFGLRAHGNRAEATHREAEPRAFPQDGKLEKSEVSELLGRSATALKSLSWMLSDPAS